MRSIPTKATFCLQAPKRADSAIFRKKRVYSSLGRTTDCISNALVYTEVVHHGAGLT